MVMIKKYKKCKGIAKGTVRRQMKYEEFETVLKIMWLYISHLIVLEVKTTEFLV